MTATIPDLRIVQEETVNQFQGQHFVEFGRVVTIPFNVAAHYSLEAFAFDIGSGERALVEQHLLKIPGQGIPVPDAEMEGLVSAQEQVFGADR